MSNVNPILPLDEYIPDGEPHAFGDRIYLFGSHDREGAKKYCAEAKYVGWSAPISDPTAWEYHGVIYEPTDDPEYSVEDNSELYAPDVMQGTDGRYYLYYCFGGTAGHSRIGIAVCDTPAGRYRYYGYVQNPDGSVCKEYLMGDPGVLNDDGVPRLVAGWSLSMVAANAHSRGKGTENAAQNQRSTQSGAAMLPKAGDPDMNRKLAPIYRMLFHRNPEETADLAYPLMGANAYTLEDDMKTVKEGPFRIVPGQFDTTEDSSFRGHAFYEASSLRKINGLYYFIYSSENSNELCYATSRYYNRDYVYGGTIISNGDVGYAGRKAEDRCNQTANDHGSLVCIDRQWYIFHHRQTHKSTFSRQACAEKVTIDENGAIAQVPCTSMGLGSLLQTGITYPATISCVLTNGHMPHITNTYLEDSIPCITNVGEERFITDIEDGTTIGYRYFDFQGKTTVRITLRGSARGTLTAYAVPAEEAIASESQIPGLAAAVGETAVSPSECWTIVTLDLTAEGAQGLYFVYRGEGRMEMLEWMAQ